MFTPVAASICSVNLMTAAGSWLAVLATAVIGYMWLRCSLVMPYTVQVMFTRLERVSSGIAALRAAEEEHFSIRDVYSSDAGMLAARLEPGLSVEVLEASEAGYSAALRLPAGQLVCDVRLDRNAAPPQDLTLDCRPCVLDQLVYLKAEPDSVTVYAGETLRLRALARGTGAGCQGVLDTLYDWGPIPTPDFASADSTVAVVLRQRGSDAAIHAAAPGRTAVAVAVGGQRVAAAVTVLPLDPVEQLAVISAGQPNPSTTARSS